MEFRPSRILLVAVVGMTLIAATPTWASERVLHTFTAGKDGGLPQFAVVLDKLGNLYGTTFEGGANNLGVIFMLTPTTSGPWKETILHHFTGGKDGSHPSALAIDSAGILYGIAEQGGTPTRGTLNCQQHGCGTLFKLFATSSGWRFNLLHAFIGASDGAYPSGLTRDAAGNLFVTTWQGGPVNAGAVFEMSPSPTGLRGTSVHVFNYTDGQYPSGGVVEDPTGNLFGVTQGGGKYTGGVVYELTPTPNGWTESTVYAFADGNPYGVLARDSSGSLYGLMYNVAYIHGAVFQVSPSSSNGWTESVIYAFTGGADGGDPQSAPVVGPGDNLFGTTLDGGTAGCQYGCGVVYELSHASGTWTQSVLYSFTGNADGGQGGGLTLDPLGNLFGVTWEGGMTATTCGCGVVFEVPAAVAQTVLENGRLRE